MLSLRQLLSSVSDPVPELALEWYRGRGEGRVAGPMRSPELLLRLEGKRQIFCISKCINHSRMDFGEIIESKTSVVRTKVGDPSF